MPDPLDDIRYFAERIGIAEAQATKATSIEVCLAYQGLARLYRERLTTLLEGSLDGEEERWA